MLTLLLMFTCSCSGTVAEDIRFQQTFEGDYDLGDSGLVYGYAEGTLSVFAYDGKAHGHMTNTGGEIYLVGYKIADNQRLTFQGTVYEEFDSCFTIEFEAIDYKGIKGEIWGCKGFDLVELTLKGYTMKGTAYMAVMEPIDPYFMEEL